jgi:hypothetical protein
MEWRLGLGLDLLNRHTISNLNQRQPVRKVDIKDTLFSVSTRFV